VLKIFSGSPELQSRGILGKDHPLSDLLVSPGHALIHVGDVAEHGGDLELGDLARGIGQGEYGEAQIPLGHGIVLGIGLEQGRARKDFGAQLSAAEFFDRLGKLDGEGVEDFHLPYLPDMQDILASQQRFLWVRTAPLGLPVVPDVWMMRAGSSGERGGKKAVSDPFLKKSIAS
jgi:hypothetical protein